jgi:Ham1 family protein
MKTITFITGNQHKADALARVLGLPLAHRAVDLMEIQSTSLEEVVEHKVRQAYMVAKCPVLVEDVALEFTALGGLARAIHQVFCRGAKRFRESLSDA